MAYIVQAVRSNGISDAESMTVASREEALDAAVRWLDEGHLNIKIIGDGRIYTPTELAATILNQRL